jgi:diguanylate cyclase (GGDEF)-like protein
MAVANKHMEKAERLMQKGKIQAALEEYLHAWQDEPDNDAIVTTVAELYQKLNQTQHAKDCYAFLFDRAIEKSDARKVMELTRKMQLLGMLDPARLIKAAKMLEEQLPGLAAEQYKRAAEVAGEKNPEIALQSLQGLARLSPGSLEVHKRLAATAQEAGQKKVAAAAHRRVAELYLPIGKTDEAIHALEQVCFLTPKDVSAKIALARAYIKGRCFAEVLALWKGVAYDPEDTEIMGLLAQAHLAEKNMAEAEQYYWKLLDGSPQAAGSLLEVAKQYVGQKHDLAMSSFMKRFETRIKQANPTKELTALAEQLAQLEHTSVLALESLSRILDRLHLDGPLTRVLSALFELYFASRQYSQAAEILDRLISVDPYNTGSTAKLERLQGKASPSVIRDFSSRLGITSAPAEETEPKTETTITELAVAPRAAENAPVLGGAMANPLKDLMLQAEIFLQYGMQDKAKERMERIAKQFPGEEANDPELAKLFAKAGVSPAAGPAGAESPREATESRDFQADLRRVSEISRDLSRLGTVKAILSTAVNEIGKHWQVSRCVVGLATPNRPPTMAMEYIAQGVAASDAAHLSKLVMGLQQADGGKREMLVAENALESPPIASLKETLTALQVESLIAIPLRDGGQEIGVLVLQQCNQRRVWNDDGLAALEALGEQIVLAIANVRLRNLMKALAVTDESSGLLHRDSYITCLLSEAERMRSQKAPLSVVLLHFSVGETTSDEVKETNGSQARGTETFIQKYSASIMGQLRQNDIAIRYASDTLALILPGAVGSDATGVTAKLRRLAASTAGAEAALQPHLAAGVAEAIRELSMDSTDRVTELINRAESALEAARADGPDAVKLVSPPELTSQLE